MFGMADLAGKSLQPIIWNFVQLRNFVTADYPRVFEPAQLIIWVCECLVWQTLQESRCS